MVEITDKSEIIIALSTVGISFLTILICAGIYLVTQEKEDNI